MDDERPEQLEERALVLAPTARDAATSKSLLEAVGVRCCICKNMEDLYRELGRGAGAAIVTAEAILSDKRGQLASFLTTQPAWSDFPLVVLTPPGAESPKLLTALEAVGNMTFVKRPVQVSALVSIVRSALRDRRRQYAVRGLLAERQQAADALRAERERYRVTLSSIGDAVISTDAEGRVTFLNGVAEALTGWTQPEAIGRDLAEVFRIVNEHTRLPVEGPALVGLATHTILIAKDGTERPVEDSVAPMRDETGRVLGTVFVFRDITERRHAETERTRQAESLRLALAAADLGTWEWATETDLIALSDRAAEIYGIAPGRTYLREWMRGLLRADHRERAREVAARAVAERSDYDIEYPLDRPGERPVWVAVRGRGAYDSDGRMVRMLGVVQDVTARKRAEEDLARVTAESERLRRLYETILANTPDLIYVFGLDHRFTYANEALLAMWGRTRHEAIGKNCLELGYPDWHASRHDREIEQVIATKMPIRGEAPFAGTQGERTYDYIFVPVLGADGEVEAVAGTTRDITDRKRMEDVLRDTDRKKDEFIALLAHELRNPLAPIRNGLQVIRLADDANAVSQARAMMERQLSHMVRLIDDLLDVSRISRNKLDLRRERVRLADIVNSAVETGRPLIDAGRHQLTVALPHRPVCLDADLMRLAQVFSNLLTNSAKYTEPGGRIWLTAERVGDEVVVSVRDTGIGIPAESLGTIFDMFSQVDRPIERSSGGLGIGLALVKGLVEMHGGTVTAKSDGEGQGSTFTVKLPALPEELGSATGGTCDAEGSALGPKLRVLVADDNRDGADSLALMLRLMGNEVRTANDGVEAVEQAERFRPEVILMDVGMPRLNGLDATRRIREQPWGKNVTIVALTGWGQASDRERSREAGCDRHLVKPVDLTDLEKLLSETIRTTEPVPG